MRVKIRRALGSILMTWDETLKPVRRGETSRVDTSKEAPMPISAHILDVRAMCCSRMAGWCLVVIEDRDLHTEHLSGLDVRAMADLLVRHSDWLGDHEAAAEVVDELETSARDLRQIVAPHDREWMSLGPCPLHVDSPDGPVLCDGQVRAYPDADPYCDGCGIEAVTGWWEQQMFTDPELRKLLTADELVTFIHKQFGRPVTKVVIRQWVARKIITKADTNERGQSLYDKGAVAYALQRRKVLA